MRIIAIGWIFFGLISRIIDFNLKIILTSAKLFTKPSVRSWTEQVLNFAVSLFGRKFHLYKLLLPLNIMKWNDTDNRPFARWRHFTTTTRIPQGFAFMCK